MPQPSPSTLPEIIRMIRAELRRIEKEKRVKIVAARGCTATGTITIKTEDK